MEVELLDVYDENRNKTGIVRPRGKENFKEGEYFLSVEALIINSKKEILISKRSESKKLYPGYWEINGGGSLANETSLEAIIRELNEELGIKFEEQKAILLKTIKNEIRFKDVWLFEIDIDIKDLKFQYEEVTDAKWIDIDTFEQMIEEGTIKCNITREDYEKAIELLNI